MRRRRATIRRWWIASMEDNRMNYIYCEVIVKDIHSLMVEMGCKKVTHYLAHKPDLISIRHSSEHVICFIDNGLTGLIGSNMALKK